MPVPVAMPLPVLVAVVSGTMPAGIVGRPSVM
jgi:hypothetical protein